LTKTRSEAETLKSLMSEPYRLHIIPISIKLHMYNTVKPINEITHLEGILWRYVDGWLLNAIQ